MANIAPKTDHLKATQFKPGHPGSGGRPRKRPLTESHDDLLRTEVPPAILRALAPMGIKKGATWAEAISLSLAHQAVVKGNVLAAKEMRESTEGKAPQRIEVMSHEDKRVEICVQYDDPVDARDLDAFREKAHQIIDVTPENAIVVREPSGDPQNTTASGTEEKK